MSLHGYLSDLEKAVAIGDWCIALLSFHSEAGVLHGPSDPADNNTP